MFAPIYDLLSINPTTGDYSTVWKTVQRLYDEAVVPVATGIMLIYFLVAILEKSKADQFNLEQFLMIFIKLIIAQYLIENGLTVLTWIYSLGFSFLNAITDVVGKDTTFSKDTADAVWNVLVGEDVDPSDGFKLKYLGTVIGALCQLIIPFLITMILKIVVYFICYTRLIELYVRTCIAPIALADFFTEGIHGSGWKFLKNYMAIALQGAIIMVAAVIFTALAAGLLKGTIADSSGYWSWLVKYLALAGATVGLMFKSLTLCKEMVGTA